MSAALRLVEPHTILRHARRDNSIPPNARLLLQDIYELQRETGYCFAKDRYFATEYQTDIRTVRRWIKSLEDAGYIERRHFETKRGIRLAPSFAPKTEGVGQNCPRTKTRTHRTFDDTNLGQSCPTPSIIYNSERESTARTHEDAKPESPSPPGPGIPDTRDSPAAPVETYYGYFPNMRGKTTIYQIELLNSCTDRPRFIKALDYWKGNDYLARSVQKLVQKYRELATDKPRGQPYQPVNVYSIHNMRSFN